MTECFNDFDTLIVGQCAPFFHGFRVVVGVGGVVAASLYEGVVFWSSRIAVFVRIWSIVVEKGSPVLSHLGTVEVVDVVPAVDVGGVPRVTLLVPLGRGGRSSLVGAFESSRLVVAVRALTILAERIERRARRWRCSLDLDFGLVVVARRA